MNEANGDYKVKRPYRVVHALWFNWAISFGAMTLPLLLALVVPRIWIPFICFTAGYSLIAMMRSDVDSGVSSCSMLVRLSSQVMLIGAAVMFIIVLLCTDRFVPAVVHLELYNSEIPFITCLVIYPIAIVLCCISLATGYAERKSRLLQRRNGYYAGDSIVATLYYKESKYQLWVLLVVATLMGGFEYWYYFTEYLNANLNEPDQFFFNYVPVTMYAISLLFFAGRYARIHRLYRTLEESNPAQIGSTIIRYLVFYNDDLLLANADTQFDTPYEQVLSHCQSISEERAREIFVKESGIEDFQMRYCYTNDGFAHRSNVIHYAVFIDDEKKEKIESQGIWFNDYMIDQALATNSFKPSLANELYRIHTITMAWKTYDRRGRRLYPIKHYRPTFRFRDLKKWAVNYDDISWFDVAENNEDRRFFTLRHLWQQMTDVFRRTKTKK